MIEQGGERIWRLEDFAAMPFTAVAQALSRLYKSGRIQRLSKGIYYTSKETVFGSSQPNPSDLLALAKKRDALFPAGIIAAHSLGFTTQVPKFGEVSTPSASLPRKLMGQKMIIHTRRPAAWSCLTPEEAALLELMRRGGQDSELSPEETLARVLTLLKHEDRYSHLVKISDTEPPRIRALLGALGEQLKVSPSLTQALHASINPFSRFDFGVFFLLPKAKEWQAKR